MLYDLLQRLLAVLEKIVVIGAGEPQMDVRGMLLKSEVPIAGDGGRMFCNRGKR